MVGAGRELRAMNDGWEKDKLKEYCAERDMKCLAVYNVVGATPKWSLWVHQINRINVKESHRGSHADPFELYTCLLEVVNLLNQYLKTPMMAPTKRYSLGKSDQHSVPSFRHKLNPRHRFEFCQRIVDSLWKKWSRDVLPHLLPSWEAEQKHSKRAGRWFRHHRRP